MRALQPLNNGKLKIQNTSLIVTPFTDYEIELAKSQKTRNEEREIIAIQEQKARNIVMPYVENIKQCEISLSSARRPKTSRVFPDE